MLPRRRRRRSGRLALLGPAFVASVAYIDPGNVATNVTAGSEYGYVLVWVVLLANLVAMLVQYLSAKLGIVTGRSLAEELGQRLPRPARVAYWVQAEIIAMATDMAEVIGGAVALSLLFGLPLIVGALITVVVSVLVLRVGDARGQGALERLIVGFLALIALGFLAGLFVAPPSPGRVVGGLVPRFDGAASVTLASGIVGATVMPHVIYLHSSLTSGRLGPRGMRLGTRALVAATRIDVVLALLLAGLLNLSLLVLAATSLSGQDGTDTLAGVHAALSSQLGAGVALLFAVALLCSGLASAAVGNAAGAEVMKGLLRISVPLWARRIATAVPALVVLRSGWNPTEALVASQVVLSAGIPFALVPLVAFTARRDVLGGYANHPYTTAAASVAAVLIICLNGALIWLTLTGGAG